MAYSNKFRCELYRQITKDPIELKCPFLKMAINHITVNLAQILHILDQENPPC